MGTETSIEELCSEMIASDLEKAKQNAFTLKTRIHYFQQFRGLIFLK